MKAGQLFASWQVVLRPVHNLWRLAGELTDVHARDGPGLSSLARRREVTAARI
jgi:hypothetical protein